MTDIETNVQSQVDTKTCPYCGEEINVNAIKCKHCGEFLNETNNGDVSQTKNNIVDVNEKWQRRFKAVEKQTVDGKWWKLKPEFWKSPLSERQQLSNELYFSDFMSTLASYLFGGVYYLCKGMWLKCLVYVAACIVIEVVLVSLVPDLANKCAYLYGAPFMAFAPYDYYRLKVLGKQW